MREKMSKPPPPAPTASAIGPCPTVIQIVGRPGTGSFPSTIAPPDHPPLSLGDGPMWTKYCLGVVELKTTNQPIDLLLRGWSGCAMVLGKLPVPGRPTIWMIVGQWPTALTVGAGGLFGHFHSPLSFLSSFSLSLGDGPI